MANVGEILDLAEQFIGKAGSSGNDVSRVLLRKILNTKLAKLYEETGWQGDDLTILSVADTIEYDIPDSGVPITPDDISKVFVDTERASFLLWEDLERLQSRKSST